MTVLLRGRASDRGTAYQHAGIDRISRSERNRQLLLGDTGERGTHFRRIVLTQPIGEEGVGNLDFQCAVRQLAALGRGQPSIKPFSTYARTHIVEDVGPESFRVELGFVPDACLYAAVSHTHLQPLSEVRA